MGGEDLQAQLAIALPIRMLYTTIRKNWLLDLLFAIFSLFPMDVIQYNQEKLAFRFTFCYLFFISNATD